jgi:hypothetical protein
VSSADTADRAQIERLLYEYAYRLDAGDFTGFAELFRDGTWLGQSGYDAVLSWLDANIYRYAGIPLTQHVVSNICVEVDGDDAQATSYLTVVQRSPRCERLEVITTVCYEDRLGRTSRGWLFRERRPMRRLGGDNTRHRREGRELAAAGGDDIEMADRIQIRALVDRYALAADQRDGDAIAGLFAPDGALLIFDRPDLQAEPLEVRNTYEALAAGPRRLDRYLSTFHFVGQHVLNSGEDGPTGITYCIAHHLYETDGRLNDFVVHLRYLDDYVSDGQRWRFQRRRLVFDFVEHRPVGGALL